MLLDASLVQDEASQIDWVVQTAEDGTARTVVLGVPSRAEVLALWGLSGNALPSDAQGADAVAASPDAADKARVDKLVAALGALVSPARAGEPPAPTRKPGTASTSKQVVTQWADNNIGSRPSTDAVSPTLTFTLYDADGNVMHVDEDGLIISDGGTEAKDLPATPENVKKYLGMDAAPSAGTRQTAVNTYVSTADALPATVVQTTWAQDEDDNGLIYDPDTGNPVYVSTDASYRIEWSMTDMADYAGYGYLRNAASYGEGAPDTQYLQLLSEESFRIVGKVGDDTLEELGGSTSGYLYIDVVVNNEVKATYALDDLMVGGGNGQAQASIGGAFGWLPDEGSCSGTLSASLPRYTVAGEPIEYRIVYRDFVADDDYYAAAYDNSASVNHGAVVDAAYTGGTVVFTHTGTTEFAAYKQWFDGKNAALRTEVSFSLWRYSDGSTPGSVDHASQVRAADGSFITLVATPEDADENGRVDLGALLKEQYPGLALDKYDSDGYPFVYGVREDTAVANYTVEFDGTAPNYYNVAADATIGYTDQNRDPNSTADAWTRPANDHLTYNGGTVENHLSGTKQVRQMKTWSVAAFQDQLQNVRCVFTLQRRDRETGAWTPALDAEGAPVTQAIEGFNAETLTQEIAGTYPKYDDDGYEIAYRWVETDVVQEGRGADETQFERDEEANAAEFTLYLHARESSADAAEPVRFTSFMGEDGTIVNSFDNATHENVEKLWEQPDGTYARQQPDQARTDTVTVRVYQNTTLVGEFVLDGKADAEATPFDDRIQGNGGSGPAAAQETSPYYLEITGLPQYSATGAKYVYRVVESEPAGWDSDRVYDAENHLTTITNSYGPGEGTDFHLLKEWTDGDDSAHRLICYVTVRAARDLTARDGSLRYRAGEVIRADIALSEANAWFYELVVPVDGLTTDDIVIEETRLDALDGSESFEVFTRDEAVAAGLGHEDWVNAGWTNDLERVATHEHAYEVTYAAEAAGPFGEQTLTVNNRRIGLIDLTVEKEWIDGSAAPDERPAAELVLRVDDPEARFFVEGGNAYAQLAGGNKIPLYDQDGAPLDSARVEDGGMALVVPVSPDSDTSTYGFFGLPKYKGIASDGEVVHYTVEERFANQQEQGDYVISSTTGDYVIGPIHFHDTQTYHVANRRTATTEVTFYKEWNDVYVNEALQRPDIALTLYQVSKATNEKPVAVDGYIHYLWRAATDGEGGSAFGLSNPTPLDASQYLQSCTIDGLPKYDRYGDEITYYAVEEFMNDGASLGYGDVTFSASRMTGSHDPADPQLIEVASGNAANIDDSAGTAYAVRSGGTFVNSLTGTLVANGTKLWSNLPGSVQSADIPEIVVFLQRKLATDDEWPDLYVERDASGAWVPAENADGSVGAVAWTSRMEQAPGDGNRYTYSIASPGDNSNGPSGETLPAFDEHGNLYQYRAREVMVGLLDTPGYLQSSDVGSVNFAQDAGLDAAGQVYSIRHGQTGSFYLNNAYDATKGSLTVKKLFDGRDAGDAYPDVEFVLYRQYEGEAGPSSPERVAVGTISAEEFGRAEAERSNATYTFEELEVYAPNGTYWRYWVVEASMDGYATQVGLGDLTLGAAGLGAGAVGDEGVASPAAMKDDGTSMVVAATPGADGTPVYDTAVDVTFANAYEADTLELTGAKTWTDYNNAFGVRPSDIQLTLSRTSASGQEEPVSLQSNDPDADNYLEWTQKGADVASWTYTISNLEQWAPDGSAWTYTIAETLTDGTMHYRTQVGTATGSGKATEAEGSYEGAFGNLNNRLKGSVVARKAWEDGDDAWGLRPTSVEVQLQARYKALNAAEGGYSAWASAADVFARLVGGVPSGFPNVEQTLAADNAWSHTWNSVPVRVKDAAGAVYEVEYRVVETKVGADEATFAPANDTGASIVYDTAASYNGQQHTTWNANEGSASLAASSSTLITNVLDDTELTVRKAWDDNGNEWGLRDVVYDQYRNERWSVTYKLQRSSDNGATWDWVTDAEGRVVTASITGSMDAQDATFGSNAATFANLPAQDADGNAYRYRAVEAVPGGYDVENPLAETPLDEGDALVAGDSGQAVAAGGAHQVYVNSLYTIGLSGTKAWEDYGTGFAPAFDQNGDGVVDRAPSMVLHRTTDDPADQNAQWEEARTADGTMPQPAWSEGTAGMWTWAYSGLPRTDGDGNAYTYRASETAGSIPGFYPVYAGGSTQVGADGNQTGDGIANTATRFTLDKVNDWDADPDAAGVQGERLDGIELAVMSRDGRTTYAVWQRDAQGRVATWASPSGVATGEVWPNGTGNGQADTAKLTPMTGGAATYVVGLAAGDYLVRETGAVPQDHVRADDVPFALAADGTVSSGVDGAVSQDDGVACVTAVDPVFRGYFEFAKALADDAASPVQGATFDLYRVGTAAGGGDELMAQGLTSGADGSFASADSDIALVGQTDGRRAVLSDGLQAGAYYLLEVGTSDAAHLPDGDAAKFAFTLDAVANHGEAHAVTVRDNAAAEPGSQPASVLLNDPFKATVTLFKYDAESGEGISETEFRLTYTPAGGGAPTVAAPRTNAEGMLVLELSGKGSYELVETANEGYVANAGFKATFSLGNEDHNGEFDLADAGDRAAIEAVVEGADVDQDGGLANTRLTGSASFRKESAADGAALDGAVFALQRQRVDATWEDVATGLATGKAYAFDAAAGSAAEDASAAPAAGVLRVSGLPWGTYRFVETTPAGGFAGQVGDEPAASAAFVVARDTVEAEAVLQDVENQPTRLVLRKTNEDGTETLPGARFTVTPVGAGAFADGATGARELTTGADGTASLEGQLCVGATYAIAEAAAPAGYELAGGTLHVTVQADGSLTAADGISAPWSLNGNAATVSLADEPIRAFVKKVDANDETKALSGVAFDVVGAFADGAASKSVETGADGAVLIEGLVAGNRYQVTETGVPAGYTRIAGTFAFDVRADGTLVPVGDMVGYRVDTDGVTVVAADSPTRLAVEKVAEDGTPLPGARFTVTPVGAGAFADGTTGARGLTTGEDGTASLEGQLCVGATYAIAETAAPAGYELIAGTLSVRVAEDGALEATGVVPNGYEKSDANTFTVRAVDTPVVVGLQKVSTDDYATPLAGAEFVVKGAFADGSTEQRLTTDGGGLVNLEALLVAGETYTVVEARAADGHEIVAGSFGFAVAADGTITVAADSVEAADGQPGYQIADGGAIALTAADTPIKARIMKTNRDGEPLAGAVFEIVPHDGSEARTFTSGSDGAVEIDAAWLVAGASYTISEVFAPAGHELAGSATFVVNADGTLSFVGADAGGSVAGKEGSGLYTASEDADGTAVVSVKDDLIRVSLIKRDAAGNALAGAEFAVQGRFPDGDVEKTFSSDDAGVLFQDYVLLGSAEGERYLIRETQAPAGYELLGDVVLRVHDDGTVAVDEATPEGVRGAVSVDQADGTAVVTVRDAAIEVELRKVSEDGKALSGAEFKVVGTFADGAAEKALESAQDGTATLASLVAGESYTVTEQKAPDGYRLIEKDYTFTVRPDGTLAGEAGAGYAIVDDGLVLQVTNERIPPATLLSKTGDGQGPVFVLLGVAAALSAAAGAGAMRRLRRRWERPRGA